MPEMKSLIILERADNLIQKVPNWDERVIIAAVCTAIQKDLARLEKQGLQRPHEIQKKTVTHPEAEKE